MERHRGMGWKERGASNHHGEHSVSQQTHQVPAPSRKQNKVPGQPSAALRDQATNIGAKVLSGRGEGGGRFRTAQNGEDRRWSATQPTTTARAPTWAR